MQLLTNNIINAWPSVYDCVISLINGRKIFLKFGIGTKLFSGSNIKFDQLTLAADTTSTHVINRNS